ncbi:KWG Leptospira repeat protein [Caldicellulosiruptor hydrothermalis 108]|uniref:KWG Leptospira repeat protein n=1 Tax=Caldicellulosiruptor hydrothermalis (strain DSM 18901 / VKM B-2411 / 108) TaxID=632292 RepID=E4Q9B3_CALH1|nr:WG repeat-containing protein [Caldicellulosiruptor hydrothermalis]ADQ05784.1 KWG Leptospira repeat protein [Caldicellulosiruptor hydrothermalis 108]
MKKVKIFICFLLVLILSISILTLTNAQQASSRNFVYIKPQFENVMFWENGWISYLQGGKWGILSSSGNILLKPQFDKIEPIVYDGASIMGIEDKFYKDIFVIWQNWKAGFIDTNAKIIVKPELDSLDVINPWINIYVCKKDNKYGFLNLDKKIYVTPQFEKMCFVHYMRNPDNKKEFSLNTVDLKDAVWPDSYLEYILVSKDGKCGAIDTNGNVVVEFKYNSFKEALADSKFAEAVQAMLANESNSAPSSDKNKLAELSPNYVSYEIENNKYYLIFGRHTNRGYVYTKSKEGYENAKVVEANKLVAVYKNKKWGIVDINGNFVVKPQFDDIKELSEGFIAFKQNGKWGFMDKNFKVAIKPQFDKAENFSEGYAAVMKSNLWGYINPSGKFVIKPQYTKAGPFFAQMAAVATKDYVGLIDTKGSFVIKFSTKNSQYMFVDTETYRFRYAPDSILNSSGYSIYKYTLIFPKFGYAVIDKKTNKVGLVLRGQGK